jgi:RNA polymerase sigma factor (sigma-70 family)
MAPANDTGGPRLDPEQRRLFDEGMPMVEQCAREVGKRYHVPHRDLLGPGTIALYEAVETFDRGQHASFSVYARHHLRGRMIDAIRFESPSRADRIERVMERAYERVMATHTVPVDIVHDSEEAILDASRKTQAEILAASVLAGLLDAQKEDPAEGVIERLWLRDGVARLVKHERAVIHLVYWEHHTLEEAAAALGIPPITARRRHASALQRLHALLVEERARRR